MPELFNCLHQMIHGTVLAKMRSRWKNEKGQTMVEYVMLIVLVALAVFLLTPNVKSAIVRVFSNTSSALK